MSVTSNRSIVVRYSGDMVAREEIAAAESTTSAAVVEVWQLLASSFFGSTFSVPVANWGLSETCKCLTIVKPPNYTGTIYFRATSSLATTDSLKLHPTDPDCITFASTVASFNLKATADVELRFIWT